MKKVSVAKAKDTLPALLHEAETAPVEIVRRGKPVAVIVAVREWERLRGKSSGVWLALERFRATHELHRLSDAFDGVRDRGDTGRPVSF